MSRFFTERYASLVPYTPGEQPQDRRYVKLNTNESPFPPAPGVAEAAAREAANCRLYSDPESRALREAFAESLGLWPSQVLAVNGSGRRSPFRISATAFTRSLPSSTTSPIPRSRCARTCVLSRRTISACTG